MKVIHLTNNLTDGAGRAVYRLHKALLGQGVASLLLVFKKDCSDDNTVIELSPARLTKSAIKSNKDILCRGISFILFILRQFYWKLKVYKRWKALTAFNPNISFVSIHKIRRYLENIDIICLYSVQGFLSSRLIREIYLVCKAPIVWTPLDIEPLTGGCHFNNGCMRFRQSCGNCPQLANRKGDISRRILSQKKKDLKELPIALVAGSFWAHDCIRNSSLFGSKRTKRIYLSVDQDIFAKVDKKVARKILKLPNEKKIILFGAFSLSDKRKGGEYLLAALRKLHDRLRSFDENLCDSVMLLTMGRKDGFKANGLPFNWKHLGEVRDDRLLSLVYQASDVLASPSIDDFGPMMVNEALMCATPVVAFHVGVAPDLIKSRKDGYLAKNYCVDDFSSGLFQCLFEDRDCHHNAYQERSEDCRPSNQAKQYVSLFEEVLIKNECQI